MLAWESPNRIERTREVVKTRQEETTLEIEHEDSILAQTTVAHVKQEIKQEDIVIETKTILP